MNPRVLTPAIALISFAATLALIAGRAGRWHAAPETAAPLATVAMPAAAAERPESEPVGAPRDEPAIPPPAAQPVDTHDYPAVRDRAAGHSSRTR